MRVWHLAAIYGTIQIAVYGLIFFLPSQVAKLMGATLGFRMSLVAAIPWAVSAVGVYFIPRIADRYPVLREPISAACMILSAIGILISAFGSPLVAIVMLSLAAVGFLAQFQLSLFATVEFDISWRKHPCARDRDATVMYPAGDCLAHVN